VAAVAVVAVEVAAGKVKNIAKSLSLQLKSRKLYKGGKE
jgi:hypothetical protein